MLHNKISNVFLLFLKEATLVMSEEMNPIPSVIAPLRAQPLDQMTSVPDEDSAVIKELKTAVQIRLVDELYFVQIHGISSCACMQTPLQCTENAFLHL